MYSRFVASKEFGRGKTSNVIASGLVLYLNANNSSSYPGSGTLWNDLSGQGNHAVLTNGPVYNSDNGGSFLFDGTDDIAPIGSSNFPLVSSPSTLSAWAKTIIVSPGPKSPSSFRILVSYGRAVENQARFIGIKNREFYFGGFGASAIFSDTIVPLNTWFNLTGVYDGSYASIYVNGQLVIGPISRVWNTVAETANVGRQVYNDPANYERWDGNIAQIMIYNRALNPLEVAQNFNVYRPIYGL